MIQINITNVAESVAGLLRTGTIAALSAEAAARAGAEPVEDAARRHVPHGETGKLAASIHTESRSPAVGVGEADVLADATNQSGVPYAVFQEFAWYGTPFLRPAADEAENAAQERAVVVLRGVIR